jgi:hypothetical protein
MACRISSMMCTLVTAASLAASGCAVTEPVAEIRSAPLVLQKAGELPVISRSGRFVVQATRTVRQPTDHGASGQFEWIELRSGPNQARQLLLFVHPLGQSGPTLERELVFDRASIFSSQAKWLANDVRIFDEQGSPLAGDGQRMLLTSLIGPQVAQAISNAQVGALLTSVMNLFQATATEQEMNHHRIYSSDALELSVRIAYDDAPPASEMTGAAPQ